MASILVLYGTGEGQTATVADRIATVLADRGHDAETVDATEWPGGRDVDAFDAVLVGASVHGGTHQPAVREFVAANREALRARPTAFFQVSLSAAVDDPERQAIAAQNVTDFLAAADWHPDRVGVFGGALRYTEYGFLMRLVMQRIAKRATGDTDTSRDYEYTDWDEVEAFAADFAAVVEELVDDVPTGK
ncbi:flavodoxin domain-containing protein [Halostella salina]|uniref:flavodoxin domain-containing protein n=1 Tax=Halostella salina TaxID=1547897 RepID=UPI000EF852BC|nr:flavodoxin domain-containing protein [Halostella salina]